MNNLARFVSAVVMALLLSACTFPVADTYLPAHGNPGPRKIAIFLDGTENGPSSRTNIQKLHQQTRTMPEVLTFYVEGVGFRKKLIGAGTGWGIDYRTQQAYAFLLQHYRPDDHLYIFGFSRGAFSARMLAAMLNYAGLPQDIESATLCQASGLSGRADRGECAWRVSQSIYQAYKGDKSVATRVADVNAQIGKLGLAVSGPVPITTLGLWDTVEALGMVDTWEALQVKAGIDVQPDSGERNKRYGDQLCNVGSALHALSIDDNRADVFTPKLLTLPHLYEKCTPDGSRAGPYDYAAVNEVWFPGAHSDVGGGYEDCEGKAECISNVSLNWMVRELSRSSAPLFAAADERLPADTTAPHDAQDGNLLYRRVNRNIPALIAPSTYNGGKPKIHCSAIQSLARRVPAQYEYQWKVQEKAGTAPAVPKGCFRMTRQGYQYLGTDEPANACRAADLKADLPSCWFTVVR